MYGLCYAPNNSAKYGDIASLLEKNAYTVASHSHKSKQLRLEVTWDTISKAERQPILIHNLSHLRRRNPCYKNACSMF